MAAIPIDICSIAFPNRLFIKKYKYKACLNYVILPRVFPGSGTNDLHFSISSSGSLSSLISASQSSISVHNPSFVSSWYVAAASTMRCSAGFQPLRPSVVLGLLVARWTGPLPPQPCPLFTGAIPYSLIPCGQSNNVSTISPFTSSRRNCSYHASLPCFAFCRLRYPSAHKWPGELGFERSSPSSSHCPSPLPWCNCLSPPCS